MKLFTAAEIREWERHTCERQGITSLDLMERAATTSVRYIEAWWSRNSTLFNKVMVFCGKGNNGGDGLVIARKLAAYGIPVSVYIVQPGTGTPGFETNMARLKQEAVVPVQHITEAVQLPQITPETLVLDCILGTGLNKPVTGFIAAVTDHINRHKSFTLAIDIPSGLPAEITDDLSGQTIIKADHTLTFQQPKRSFMFADSYEFTGDFTVTDIGLDPGYAAQTECAHFYLTKAYISSLIRSRQKFSHKGTYGHVLVVAGSYGKMGAAVLSGRSALRTGCGLLTVYVPSAGYEIIQTALPEAMVLTDARDRNISVFPEVTAYSAVGAGPGLGTETMTRSAFKDWLLKINKPLVLDADALNNLAELIKDGEAVVLPPDTILTPHHKEFERLAGSRSDWCNHLLKQQQFAAQYKCTVILKGAHTSVMLPDGRVFFNSTGNPLLATAGSGDVLTGIITSLLAQGYNTHDAAVFGVYLHGACADRMLEKGHATMLASEIAEGIPAVLFSLGNIVK